MQVIDLEEDMSVYWRMYDPNEGAGVDGSLREAIGYGLQLGGGRDVNRRLLRELLQHWHATHDHAWQEVYLDQDGAADPDMFATDDCRSLQFNTADGRVIVEVKNWYPSPELYHVALDVIGEDFEEIHKDEEVPDWKNSKVSHLWRRKQKKD